MTTTKVNSEFIAVNAISGTIIADGAITSTHLAANSVDSSELVTGSIDTIHIAANQVTATKIVTNGVLTRHISDDQVTADKLANSINTDIATGPAALPKAGGTMTGALAMNANAITSTGDLTLDVATNIVLDADGGGIYFKDGGTTVGFLQNDGGDFRLVTSASDKDFKILGNDGGSTITALTLDMSAAGAATFNSSVNAANLLISGAQGSDGQVLTSTGSGVAWEAVGGGATFKTFGTGSIMVGDDATGTIDAADNNTGLGTDVFAALTTGDSNTAVGHNSLGAITTGHSNTAVGFETLLGTSSTNLLPRANTAVGYRAGKGTTDGRHNTFIGFDAGIDNTTGVGNVSVGALSYEGTTGSGNTGLGMYALSDVVTGAYNTAIGYGAGGSLTSGGYNTFVGNNAGDNITTGSSNVAIGINALTTLTASSYPNIGIGENALHSLASGTGQNTAIGYRSGEASTTCEGVTLLGSYTGMANQTGSNLVAIGNAAAYAHTGGNSVAIGQGAMGTATSTDDSVFIGPGSGTLVTTGYTNVFIGDRAGKVATTCYASTCIGYKAGQNITTGYGHTLIGSGVVSAYASNSSGEIGLGRDLTTNGTGYFTVGVGTNKGYYNYGSTNGFTAGSDERLKEEITDSTVGLSFINDLRPRSFKWKQYNDVPSDMPQHIAGSTTRHLNKETTQLGMIAQEVKTVIDNHSELPAGFSGWATDAEGTQCLDFVPFIQPLIKAVQELSTELEAAKARIATLEG